MEIVGSRGWVGSAWVIGLTLVLTFGCSSGARETGGQSVAEVKSASPDACRRSEDCVSGLCRAGRCAICDILDFDTDTADQVITSGQIIENRYVPAQLEIMRRHGERGLAVAAQLRGAPKNNVLISQAKFTPADVLNGSVAKPEPDDADAALSLQFPKAVCVDSLEEIDLPQARIERTDAHRASSSCAQEPKHDAATVRIPVDGRDGIDDVKVCSVGGAPLGSGSGLLRECGVRVLDTPATPVADPCQSGTDLGTLKLGKGRSDASLDIQLPSTATLCLEVEGDREHLRGLTLDGAPLTTGSGARLRQVISAGHHTLGLGASGQFGGAELRARWVSGVFEPSSVVQDDGLTLSGADELPDVVPPGSSTKLSAHVDVASERRCKDDLALRYEFRIYSPSTCSLVRGLTGIVDIQAGLGADISASWDGKDSTGKQLPDGDYLWDVQTVLGEVHGKAKNRKFHDVGSVTSPFRRVRVWGQVSPEDCRKLVRSAIAAAGITDADDRFDVTRNMLRCGADTPSACEIDFFALVNLQRRQLATAILKDTLSPAQYLAVEQDRSRKVRLADDDRSWLAAFCAGDADQDLIPDAFDQCPATPLLTATDDHGCTDSRLPPAPSHDDVRRMLDMMKIAAAPGCSRSAVPMGSRVLSASQNADRSLHLVLAKEKAASAACQVWYSLEGPARVVIGADTAVTIIEELGVGVVGPGLVPAGETDTTIEYDVAPEALGIGGRGNSQFLDWYDVSFRVRTILGNGLQSPDSAGAPVLVGR
jgi:hypothetical protein